MYGTDVATMAKLVVESVQKFWPGVTDDKLGYGHDDADDESMALAIMARLPVFVLLANYDNDERAALAVHPDGTVSTQLLNKDTLSEEWSAFVSSENGRYLR